MSVNKQTGNMYPFVVGTWNAIKGKCPHECVYCYMHQWGKQNPARLVEKELTADLYKEGKGMIFVGSSIDMFAEDIPDTWIRKTLNHAKAFNENEYLFQTKNPRRMIEYKNAMPDKRVLAITLETDRAFDQTEIKGNGAHIEERCGFTKWPYKGERVMISIEPVMKFSEHFAQTIITLAPEMVSIGADSGKNGLPEPTWSEIQGLITALKNAGIKVIEKKNLWRLKK